MRQLLVRVEFLQTQRLLVPLCAVLVGARARKCLVQILPVYAVPSTICTASGRADQSLSVDPNGLHCGWWNDVGSVGAQFWDRTTGSVESV